MNLRKTGSYIFLAIVSFSMMASTPVYEEFTKRAYPDKVENDLRPEFPSISVKIDGEKTDTLTLFPLTGYYDFYEDNSCYYGSWLLLSKNGTVEPFVVGTFHPNLQNLGDLNGNGSDEIGIIQYSPMSNLGSYQILTYRYGNLYEALNEIIWTDDEEENLKHIVTPINKKGKIKLNYLESDPIMGPKRVSKKRTIPQFIK